MRPRAKACLGVAMLVLAPGFAAGTALHGRASTVYQWWERADDGKNVTPLTQYLSFTASDLWKGQDLTVRGYGQVNKDLASSDPFRGKVFYLYAEWNDALKDHLDVKAGRQFSQNAAGAAVVDGVDLTVHGWGPVGVRAFGGGDVQFVDDYRAGDAVGGLSLYLDGFEHTSFEVSAFTKYDHFDNSRTLFGASASQDLLTLARIYGDVQYDYLSDDFSEVLIGLRLFPYRGLILTGEYFKSMPVFDSTSIYSVFAADKYEEGRFRASYDVRPNIRVYGELARLWYDEGDKSWSTQVGTRVFDVYRSWFDVSLNRRIGYAGDQRGVRAVAGHEILPKRLTAEAGIEYQDFQREEDPSQNTTLAYWGDVAYRWRKDLATSVRIENITDAGGKNHVEGILRADWDF